MHAHPPRSGLAARRFAAPIVPILVALLLAACDDDSASQLPVWTPNDHDNRSSPAAGQTDTEAPRPRMPDLQEHGIDDVVLATWKQNCTTCHGLVGRGDGPQAPMFRPPDLTTAVFQERAIDSEILHTIEKGRGKMPAFGHLPKDTIQGLARLVRMLGPARPAEAAPSAAPATPPAASAHP